ncbi:MAG: hypothetical protein A0129_15035 [Limnobacter sp. CACIAM 66H1]|nr:MAG: hypothetical protein A0129_15035 [Limnobacter sp. CACIAM 66H1]
MENCFKKRKKKIVLYCLYHNKEFINQYRANNLHLRKLLKLKTLNWLFGAALSVYENSRQVLKAPDINYRKFFLFNLFRDFTLNKIDLARRCSVLVASCEKEASLIRKSLKVLGGGIEVKVVPHSPIFIKSKKQKSSFILVVGRIEKRKNIVSLIASFDQKRKIRVIAPLGIDAEYNKKFIDLISSKKNVTWSSWLEEDALYALASEAESVWSASWFEVMSLFEVDCIYSGIKVVSSENSYLKSEMFFSPSKGVVVNKPNYSLGRKLVNKTATPNEVNDPHTMIRSYDRNFVRILSEIKI